MKSIFALFWKKQNSIVDKTYSKLTLQTIGDNWNKKYSMYRPVLLEK
jgi:hypothetical protein